MKIQWRSEKDSMMKASSIIRLWSLLGLLALVGCNSHADLLLPENFPFYRETEPFNPARISCDTHPIEEAHAEIMRINTHQDGDLYLIRNADEIARTMQDFADQGDPDSMYFFGVVRREAFAIAGMDRMLGDKPSPFPDIFRDDLVTAISYAFIAADILGGQQENAVHFKYKTVPNLRLNTYIPPAWAEEARANVLKWKKLCGRK
jgi:hypothetical protein